MASRPALRESEVTRAVELQGKRIILVGAGHAHLYVAAHASVLTREGVRLVLVDPGNFWYSGLATGMLAGQYDAQADQVDPARLVERGDGEWVRDRLTRIDVERQTAVLASGNALKYDLLSLNIGSEVNARDLPGAERHVWTVKPISNLWRLRQHIEERLEKPRQPPLRVIVVGGGPTGCEVAACIDSLARRRGASLQLTLVARSDRLLPGLPFGAAQRMTNILVHRGIDVLLSWPVEQIEEDAVIGADDRRLPVDVAVVATGLTAPGLLQGLELPLDGGDGVRVRPTLQSVADDRIFAAGDCASLEGHRLPKLGVFGVRQAPVLLHNLDASLKGRELKPYRPQRRYLMILNLGCGRALAVYDRLYWLGRMSFWIKDRIDRRFLTRYRTEKQQERRNSNREK